MFIWLLKIWCGILLSLKMNYKPVWKASWNRPTGLTSDTSVKDMMCCCFHIGCKCMHFLLLYNYQKNIFNEYKSKNRFKSSEFNKIDFEDKIYKIENDILVRKKKEESEANNNLITFENKINNKHKIKNLICGIQFSLHDNKKSNVKPNFHNKSKKKSNIFSIHWKSIWFIFILTLFFRHILCFFRI